MIGQWLVDKETSITNQERLNNSWNVNKYFLNDSWLILNHVVIGSKVVQTHELLIINIWLIISYASKLY